LQDLLAAARNRAAVMASVAGSPVPLQGVLSFVDNTVDPQVGTVKAKAQFGNASQLLWPGQYVKTRITVRTLKDAILLPQAAVITSASGKIVYIVAQDDIVQPRKIEIDYPFGDQAALRGLLPGERVVVEGKQNLRPGSRVRVEKSGKAEPAKKDPT
jgi:multidrug efflux system membrane fusion protein